MTKEDIINQITISLCAVAIFGTMFHVSDVLASPSQPAPTNDTGILLDSGSTSQTKQGGLTVNSTLSPTTLTASQVTANTVCLQGSCRTSWPSAQYPIPTLDEVLSTGNQLNAYLVYGPVSAITLGGTYRTSWPQMYLSGKSSCYWQNAPGWFGGTYTYAYGGDEWVINGFNTDWWGNMREVQVCRLYTYTQ